MTEPLTPPEAALEYRIAELKAARAPHKKIRAARMQLARLRGTHTADQWHQLKAEFGHRCVRCGASDRHLDKDHIKPVYQGGSDGNDNLQPLCAPCNSSKGPENFNWAAYRRETGFSK